MIRSISIEPSPTGNSHHRSSVRITISLVDRSPLNLGTPVVKDMYSARFQRSKFRLWLTMVCASLTLGGSIASTTNIPALSQPTNRSSEAKQAPAPAVIRSIGQAVKQQFGVAKIVVVRAIEQNWPDGCLGLPKSEEVCTMAISSWLAS